MSDNKMSANATCCMFMGMFLSHIKFYYEYNSSNKTDKLFLMTQNCGERMAMGSPKTRQNNSSKYGIEKMVAR
eukprot:6468677-Amphidinium_carterae.1